MTLHVAELWVQSLVAQDVIATIGGRVLVGPTTTLTQTWQRQKQIQPFQVKHNEMAVGDTAYLEKDGKVEFIAITAAANRKR